MRRDAEGRSPRYLVITELFLPTKGGTAVWFDEVYRRLGGKGILDVEAVRPQVPGAQLVDVAGLLEQHEAAFQFKAGLLQREFFGQCGLRLRTDARHAT